MIELYKTNEAIAVKTIITILLCLFVQVTSADTLSLDINLSAYHWSRSDVSKHNLNETNPGIGLRYTEGDYHQMLGVYHNSDRKTSAYALMAWTPVKISGVSVGVVLGGVTGYQIKPIAPAAGMYMTIPVVEKVSVNVTAVPSIPKMSIYGFAGFQVSVGF